MSGSINDLLRAALPAGGSLNDGLMAAMTEGNVRSVGPGCHFTSVQDAIDGLALDLGECPTAGVISVSGPMPAELPAGFSYRTLSALGVWSDPVAVDWSSYGLGFMGEEEATVVAATLESWLETEFTGATGDTVGAAMTWGLGTSGLLAIEFTWTGNTNISEARTLTHYRPPAERGRVDVETEAETGDITCIANIDVRFLKPFALTGTLARCAGSIITGQITATTVTGLADADPIEHPYPDELVVYDGGPTVAEQAALAAVETDTWEAPVTVRVKPGQDAYVASPGTGVSILSEEEAILAPRRHIRDLASYMPSPGISRYMDPRGGGRIVLMGDDSYAGWFTTALYGGKTLKQYCADNGLPFTVAHRLDGTATAAQLRAMAYETGGEIAAHASSGTGHATNPTTRAMRLRESVGLKASIDALVDSGQTNHPRIGFDARAWCQPGSWSGNYFMNESAPDGDMQRLIRATYESSFAYMTTPKRQADIQHMRHHVKRYLVAETGGDIGATTYAAFVANLCTDGAAAVIMWHDTLTSEWFQDMLDAIVAARNAGTLQVVTLSGLMDAMVMPGQTTPEAFGVPWGDIDNWATGVWTHGASYHDYWSGSALTNAVYEVASDGTHNNIRITRPAGAGTSTDCRVNCNLPVEQSGYGHHFSFLSKLVSGAPQLKITVYYIDSAGAVVIRPETIAFTPGETEGRIGQTLYVPDWCKQVSMLIRSTVNDTVVDLRGFRWGRN